MRHCVKRKDDFTMWTPDYFVRYADLPLSVEGVTVPNTDGTFDIYINALLPEDQQAETLAHELEHIRKDHFYNDIAPVQAIEAEAEHPQRVMPCITAIRAVGA